MELRSRIILFILCFLSLGVNTCSQSSNVGMRYVRNFMASPVLALNRLLRGETESAVEEEFSQLLNQFEAREANIRRLLDLSRENPELLERCRGRMPSNIPAGFDQLMESVSNQLCHCNSWQTPLADCEVPCCSLLCRHEVRCEKICPSGLAIFKRNKERSHQVHDFNFAFTNSAFDTYVNRVRHVPVTYMNGTLRSSSAYNLGYISARRKFNELAFFDEFSSAPESAGAYRRHFYQEKIDALFEGKPAVIPGFKNLREFSADPEIQGYLKQKIAEEWLEKAIGHNLSELEVDPGVSLNSSQMQELNRDIERKLNSLGSTTLLFGIKSEGESEATTPQAVEVYGKVQALGETRLCVLDPNLPTEEFESSLGTHSSPQEGGGDFRSNCTPYIVLEPNGRAYYVNRYRRILDPPVRGIDSDGLPVTHRFEDSVERRELYDLKLNSHGDELDALREVEPLNTFCKETRGCASI